MLRGKIWTTPARTGSLVVHAVRRSVCALACLYALASISQAQNQGLLSHDVNGVSLDMTVAQVTAAAGKELAALGRGQYEVDVNGIGYSFGFSALGHLYRIDSKQLLGHFIPDKAFALTLTKKLTNKYGPPQTNQLPDGPAMWGFVETYLNAYKLPVNRTTESLSVMLEAGYDRPVYLDIKLMDFRILRRDLERADTSPRSHAEGDMKF